MISTGVVGLGRIAYGLEKDALRYKPCTHLGALMRLNKVFNVKYLSDLDSNKQSEFANLLPRAVFHQSYQELLKRDLDFLVIASTTSTHYAILKKALELNLPYILVEKPITDSIKKADELLSIFNKSKSKVWVNFERRYHYKYKQFKKDIVSERFGKLLYYNARFHAPQEQLYPSKIFSKSKNVKISYEGVLLHDTSHLLDLLYFLLGNIKKSKLDQQLLIESKGRVHRLGLTHQTVSGSLTTFTQSKYFHLELEFFFENNVVKLGNGFYEIKSAVKSKSYSGFISLNKPKLSNDNTIIEKINPFMNIYNEIAQVDKHGKYNNLMLTDACNNVKILLSK